jgi:hypothetical protein
MLAGGGDQAARIFLHFDIRVITVQVRTRRETAIPCPPTPDVCKPKLFIASGESDSVQRLCAVCKKTCYSLLASDGIFGECGFGSLVLLVRDTLAEHLTSLRIWMIPSVWVTFGATIPLSPLDRGT